MKQTVIVYVLAGIIAVIGALLLLLFTCENALIAWRHGRSRPTTLRRSFSKEVQSEEIMHHPYPRVTEEP